MIKPDKIKETWVSSDVGRVSNYKQGKEKEILFFFKKLILKL